MAKVETRAPRILVADANAAVLVTFDYLLQHYGYTVTAVSTGADALARILRDDFELLLIDRTLPNLSGIDVAQDARAYQPAAALLFLVDNPEDGITVCKEQDVRFDCIVKTASAPDVLGRVAAALAHACRPLREQSVDA